MMDFTKLFNWEYLTDPSPAASFAFMPHLLIFFGFLLFLALIIPLVYRPQNHLFRRFRSQISKMLWTCSLVGFVLIFFRWQSLGILQQRIWLLVLLVILVFWIFYLMIYKKFFLGRQLEFYRKQLEFKKYLPSQRGK